MSELCPINLHDRRRDVTAREVLELAATRRLLRSGEARRIRLDAGLSQTEIARSVGVTAGAVSRWETGSRRPVGEAAVRYAQVMLELEKVDDAGAH
jgi:DNA-binding transcriptional regulator YiaG